MKILEPNMYVRTKKGMIAKIVSKENVSGSLHREEIVFILDNGNRLALHSQKVVKASHNIIDLIEVGDYVNGIEVTSVNKTCEDNVLIGLGKMLGFSKFDNDYSIKTILTKQQMESMQYEVK